MKLVEMLFVKNDDQLLLDKLEQELNTLDKVKDKFFNFLELKLDLIIYPTENTSKIFK